MSRIDSVPALSVHNVVEERSSYQEIATQTEWCHGELPVVGLRMALSVPAMWPFAIGHCEHLDKLSAQASGVRESFLEEVLAQLQSEQGRETEGLPGRGNRMCKSTVARNCKKLRSG